MRIPNLDYVLYVTLSAAVVCLWLGAFIGSEIIRALGGLCLLASISVVVSVFLYAVYVTILKKK